MNGQIRRAALVTGGALRIGGAIVDALAGAGYAVAPFTANHSRDAAGACVARKSWRAGGAPVRSPADLADHGAVLRAV